MAKISYDDDLRMQTLCEQGFGTEAVVTKYPHKGRKLTTVKMISQRSAPRTSYSWWGKKPTLTT